MTDRNPMCQTRGCTREASCLGAYEREVEKTYACDGCCGHGNEDGHCEPVETIRERAQMDEVTSLREQVRALTADNAALLGAARSALQRMLAQDWSAARETLLEAAEKPHPGAALLAEMEELKKREDEYGSALHGTSVFVGPCVHERDPWDRCDECGEGSAVQALMRVANALRARVAELERRIRTVLVTMATGRLLMEDPLHAVHTAAGALGVDLSNTKNTPEEG